MPVTDVICTSLSWTITQSTVAIARTSHQALHQAILSAGWVQTTDTGQIDFTINPTVFPGTTAVIGYKVYRLNDTLQTTRPVFLKITWGQVSAAAQWHPIFVVGTATDGAGTLSSAAGHANTLPLLTGNTFSASQVTSGSQVLSKNHYVAGDGSGLAIALYVDTPGNGSSSTAFGGFFLVERTRDLDGTPNGKGLLVIQAGHSNFSGWSFNTIAPLYAWSGVAPSVVSNGTALAYNPGTRFLNGVYDSTKVLVPPVMTGFVPEMQGASNLVVAPYRNDWGPNVSFTVEHYGAPRRFVSLALSVSQNSSMAIDASFGNTIAMRSI